MKQLLQELERTLSSGEPAALVTIVEKTGSTPRGVGTAMVVSCGGRQTGTIGGGSMEARARDDALALLAEGRGAMKRYPIDAEDPADSNAVSVLIRAFSGQEEQQALSRALDEIEGEAGYLVCPISNGEVGETNYVSARAAQADAALQPLLAMAPVLSAEEPRCWVEPMLPAPRMIVLGGGHVARALVPVIAMLQYRVWVIEDREELCDRARFPQAEWVLVDRSDQVLEELDLTEQDGIVSFVRGRGVELQTLASALRTKAGYIGSIGSRANARRMRDELLSYGFSAVQVQRLHAPVGLDIGAETPEEIAVSIAAEIIAQRRNRNA